MENEIAVIIPTYNSEKTIKRAIDSVKNQVLPKDYSLRIIVVDDCSEDNTRNIIKKLDVDWYMNYESTGGPNEGRNKGIELAKDSKYIAFLDHDDEWVNGKLLSQVQALDATGNKIVFTAYRITNGDKTISFEYGQDNVVKYGKNVLFKIFLSRAYARHVLPYMSSLLIRNEDIPLFDDPVYDYGWSLRLLKDQEVVYIDRIYMIRYESSSNLSTDENYVSGNIRHIDHTLRKYKAYREARFCKKNFNFNYYIKYLMENNKKEAYKALWRTFV